MLTDIGLGAACGTTSATNDGGSTRSSSEGDAYAADAAARWKRSVAATWLGDREPSSGAPLPDDDPLAPEGTAPCDALEGAPLPEGLLDGDVDPRGAARSAQSSAAETAEFCRRYQELLQRDDQGAAWNPFAEPWESAPAGPCAQAWHAEAGQPWGSRPPGPNGADAAAGTAAVWDAAVQDDVQAQESHSETAERFCVWCGCQVPPNLVQAKFCIFCGGVRSDRPPAARPELSGMAGTPAAAPRKGDWGEAAWGGAEAESLGRLVDTKWNAMTAGERILALVKTQTTSTADVALKLQ